MAATFKSFPEYKSIETFVQFCMDDERSEYAHDDLTALNYRTNLPIHTIRAELESYGLTLKNRPVPRKTRGFMTHDYADRFKDFVGGGSGGDQIIGMIGISRPF
jgi:hypothetical protein